MTEDYYALLGVDPDASEEAILRAYRERAAEHHPDVSDAADADETFQRLNEAKDVLTDAQRRREYDRVGHDRFVGEEAGRARAEPQSRAVDVDTPQPGWPDGVGTLIQQLFGGPGRARRVGRGTNWLGPQSSRAGPAAVDLRTLFGGASPSGPDDGFSTEGDPGRPSQDEPSHPCPECGGRGRFVHDIDTGRGRTRRVEPCERCGGSGAVRE